MKETLYGANKDGSIQVWTIETYDNCYKVSFGKEGGKIQTKETWVGGKNIGRANETTPEQQAVLEAEAKVRKQIDSGYRRTKEELSEKPLLPMLAMDYHNRGHDIKAPFLVQPKLDGVRVMAFRKGEVVTLLSRGGKEYDVKHIKEGLQALPEGVVIDGELYIPGIELKEIQSAVKKANANTPLVCFFMFDLVDSTGLIPLERRLDYIYDLDSTIDLPCITSVETIEVESKGKLDELHDHYKALGYEGIMIRNIGSKYAVAERSKDLQKYKKFFDSEFEIVGVVEDKNGNAVFTCKNDTNDLTFGCAFGSFDERKEQLRNQSNYVGKFLTVKYQTRYGETNLPQFPVGLGIREGSLVEGKFVPSE